MSSFAQCNLYSVEHTFEFSGLSRDERLFSLSSDGRTLIFSQLILAEDATDAIARMDKIYEKNSTGLSAYGGVDSSLIPVGTRSLVTVTATMVETKEYRANKETVIVRPNVKQAVTDEVLEVIPSMPSGVNDQVTYLFSLYNSSN